MNNERFIYWFYALSRGGDNRARRAKDAPARTIARPSAPDFRRTPAKGVRDVVIYKGGVI